MTANELKRQWAELQRQQEQVMLDAMQYVVEHPEKSLPECATAAGCSLNALRYVLWKAGIRRKQGRQPKKRAE